MSSWGCVYVGRVEDTEESWHTYFRSRAEGLQQGHVLACKCAHMSAHMCSGPGNVHARGFPDGLVVKNLSAQAGDAGSIPGSGISPGEGNSNPLQCSCLENDRGAWWVTVHGVSEVKCDLKTKQRWQTCVHACTRKSPQDRKKMGKGEEVWLEGWGTPIQRCHLL